MTDYVKEYTSRGRIYFYFRAPAELQKRFPKQLRLRAETREIAAKQAQAIVLGQKPPPPPLTADERLYRRLLQAFIRHLLAKTRSNASRRKITIEIDEGHLLSVIRVQQYRCAITGLQFDLRTDRGAQKGAREPFRPSIDRINNSRGYVPGNCRIVLIAVNIAMSTWGDETFLKIARAATLHEEQKKREKRLTILSNADEPLADGRPTH